MNRAHKKVVIITGVSSGIGLATATMFVTKGWIVIGTVRSRGKGSALRGLPVDVQLADMLKPRDIERVVTTAKQTYGRIDAVVCNAGYGLIGPIEGLDYAAMQEQYLVNVLAPAEMIRRVVPVMRRQKGGVVVGVSSIVGRVGIPGYSLYASSKFGLEGMFESLCMELSGDNIQMKLVEPSGVHTPFWASLKGAGAKDKAGVGTTGGSLSADQVATVIFRAITDGSKKLRYPVGQTRYLSWARRILPDRTVFKVIAKVAARQ